MQRIVFTLSSGWSSVDFTAQSLLRGLKRAEKCVQLIQQCGLTHDGGTTAFVASDILNLLPQILVAVGVEVPLQSLMMTLCLLQPAFSLAPAVLYASLPPDRKRGVWLWIEPSSLHSSRPSGQGMILLSL